VNLSGGGQRREEVSDKGNTTNDNNTVIGVAVEPAETEPGKLGLST